MRFVRGRKEALFPDPDLIRTLARLLSENGLNEIEYAVGDRLIRVARGAPPGTAGAAPAPSQHEATTVAPAAGAGARAEPLAGAITSPMVGTVYLAPQPGAPPFVRRGDAVVAGQPLLIIEAMKVMNEIHAPCAGRATEILVEDAQPVEYGATLMLIEEAVR